MKEIDHKKTTLLICGMCICIYILASGFGTSGKSSYEEKTYQASLDHLRRNLVNEIHTFSDLYDSVQTAILIYDQRTNYEELHRTVPVIEWINNERLNLRNSLSALNATREDSWERDSLMVQSVLDSHRKEKRRLFKLPPFKI